MSTERAKFLSAYAVANDLLLMESRITVEAIDKAVSAIGSMPVFSGLDLDRLRKELETANNVHVAAYSVLDDKEYKAWIAAKREVKDFDFWNRYRRFLSKKKQIPEAVLDQIDRLTDDIIDRLRDPETPGSWDRRGLVVGDVQSGKTSNYTGLVCKAVDAGFPLIIVLAGLHNSLRSQTQQRLDEGFLGFDTRLHLVFERENQRIGAGALPGAPLLIAHSLTSSADNGDFQRGTPQRTRIVPGGKDPVILVVKKRVSILENLKAWVLSVRGEDDPSIPGGRTIRDVPLLIIDDEADNASANTNEFLDDDGNLLPDADPSATNKLIRQILVAFEKSAYVGYTATPFANVFMHHEATSSSAGPDLFPRSFIINLPAPSNYIGPERVFGLDHPGNASTPGLPIVHPIADADALFPKKHKKELLVAGLPLSLVTAMRSFILACAARRVRGDVNVHNSMLVHVTRFQLVQDQVAELIEHELSDMRRQLEFPGAGGDLLELLEGDWQSDFDAKAEELRASLADHDLPPVSWSNVRPHLFDAAKRIQVRRVNGSGRDALDYVDNPQGLSVIAVGGDKLSRGLTLEGLSVSYFLRTSRMYDTLMQMGRWFGYRPRYADLCRLYTSAELVKWYRHIAMATSELREEFDLALARGASPLDFGHRVRSHPDGLLITAANKMRAGAPIRAGFSGSVSETVSFDLAHVDDNFNAIETFLAGLPKVDVGKGKYVWQSVHGSSISRLFSSLKTSKESWKADARAIADYVQNRVESSMLLNWTVVLLASGVGSAAKIAGYSLSLTQRANRSGKASGTYTIGRLVSPTDEQIDLDSHQRRQALALTKRAWEEKKGNKGDEPTLPSGPSIRTVRDPANGLLLLYPIDTGEPGAKPIIGFAVSFPKDDDAPLIDYTENSVRQLESLFE